MDNWSVARRLSLRWASRIEESRIDVSILTGVKKIPICALYYTECGRNSEVFWNFSYVLFR